MSTITREFELFDVLVSLPAAERIAMLDRECADDAPLRARLLRLLESDSQVQHLTACKAVGAFGDELSAWMPGALIGHRIGPFRIQSEIGRGGMGAVYKAVREDGAVAQSVAIKLVRRELIDGPALERFRLERKVLARLDHPNIARLIDAGELEDGTPYAIMELVDGEHFIAYCDRLQLPLPERLALFRSVCEAVASAHRSLVVHRDLKSSNILVTGDGTAKLLDFGISKLIEHGADSHQTGTMDRYLSPLHAAPEQIRGQQITVGCDVYALGLLLYQLLTDAPAVESDGRTPGEIENQILHALPTVPSAHANLAQAAPKLRFPSATSLSRALRGDLDGITLRCLRKEPERRYVSVDALIADLDAYREQRPVSARGGDRWYRTQKFVRRNALPVGLSATVAMVLVVSAAALYRQSIEVREQRDEARAVTQFMLDSFKAADPGGVSSGNITARELLDQGTAQLRADASLESSTRAAFLLTLGEAQLALGRPLEADALVAEALALVEADDLEGLRAKGLQLSASSALANSEYDRIGGYLHRVDGLEVPRELEVKLRSVRSQWLSRSGQIDEALESLAGSVAWARQVFGTNSQTHLRMRALYGQTLLSAKRPEDALAELQETLALQRRHLPAGHVDIIQTTQLMPSIYGRLQQPEAALAAADELVALSIEKYGDSSLGYARALGARAGALGDAGRFDEGIALYLEAVKLLQAKLGRFNINVSHSQINIGSILLDGKGRADLAEPHFADAVAIGNELYDIGHPTLTGYVSAHARALRKLERWSELERLLEPHFQHLLRAAPESPMRVMFQTDLAQVALANGDATRALSLLEPLEPLWQRLGDPVARVRDRARQIRDAAKSSLNLTPLPDRRNS